jgi:signal transduction histidine kinase
VRKTRLGAEAALIHRYEPEGDATVVGSWATPDNPWLVEQQRVGPFRVGNRSSLAGDSVTSLVHRTKRAIRFDEYEDAAGPIAAGVRTLGVRSAVGTPIVVDGRVWGAIVAATSRREPLAANAESRVAQFTDLVATAIANVQARSDLDASRARLVAAADEERRRVVRDLQDGAQQQLAQTIATVELACRALDTDRQRAAELVDEALQHAQTATDELRELAQGILPPILSHGGLRASVGVLVSRMSIPVVLDISVERLPTAIEATAHFVVAEALANVARHSHAQCATITARLESDTLCVEVGDDGVGGARVDGSGLLRLSDRLTVLNGSLRVESPPDHGTLIAASIPVH